MNVHPTRRSLLAVAGLLALAGCGERVGGEEAAVLSATRPSVNLVPGGYDGRFQTQATVLESPDHGPQLCYYLLESLPPQCGGPDIAGWDWTKVKAQSRSGTTWGDYIVVGTFDGDTFTLTEPARADDGSTGYAEDDELTTPCPEPPGGWQPVDPERATDKAFQEATRRAQATSGFGDLWIDQQIPDKQLTEWNSNDPKRFALNITTTGDITAMESAVREVWGGSLCVSETSRSQAELTQIEKDLPKISGMVSLSSNGIRGQVEVTLLVAAQELQQQFDERFGKGAVRLWGQLEPIDL